LNISGSTDSPPVLTQMAAAFAAATPCYQIKVLHAANTTAAVDGSLKGVLDAAPINLPQPDFIKNLDCRCRPQQEIAIYWW